MPKVTIIIINYNGLRFLQSCLTSLTAQTYWNKEIIFIDNNSTDKSVEFVQAHFPSIIIFANKDNKGYTGAANQGIKAADSRYVMIMNPDIIFESDYLEKAVQKMENNHRIGALTGKLYKYDFEKKEKTEKIDSLGLYCFRNRRIIDKCQGQKDKAQFDISKEVFGVSGACPFYRRHALNDIAINGEIFDENFFMYKEDIDISWRMRLRGWKCYYLADAIAHHGRGTGILKDYSHFAVMQNRKSLSRFTKHYSYRNQRLMQLKNEMIPNIIHDFIPIFIKEVLIAGYILVFEPYLIKSLFQFFKLLPSTLKKRRFIMKNKKVGWEEMRVWLEGKK